MSRAILINPYARTVTEVDVPTEFVSEDEESPKLEAMTYEGLRAAVFTGLQRKDGCIQHIGFAQDAAAWIDEEGLLRDWSTQAFVATPFYPQPLAGNVLLTGKDAGGNAVALNRCITAGMVAGCVAWVAAEEVRAEAPKVYSIAEDGTRVLLHDGGTWDFEHQPTHQGDAS